MGSLIGAVVMMAGVIAVVLGVARDLARSRSDQERQAIWIFTVLVLFAMVIGVLFVRLFPGWLAWVPWLGLFAILFYSVQRLQATIRASRGRSD
ncbi:MAG: hypothetical protein MK116_12560 [Phycisphaerales bacterium]|nr:hypothetical protein [Phycisphaerales bacterium]